MRRIWMLSLMLVGLVHGCAGGCGPESALCGPWVWYDQSDTPLFGLRFDGGGGWDPIMPLAPDVFDPEAGTYVVTEDVVTTVTVSHPTLAGFPLTGTLNAGGTRVDLNPAPMGYLEPMANPGFLAGTWSGLLVELVSYNVSFVVDSQGDIVSLTAAGFENFETGWAYHWDDGVTVGEVIYWRCNMVGDYNEVLVTGTLSGNTINAIYFVDDGDAVFDGGASLVRQ